MERTAQEAERYGQWSDDSDRLSLSL